MRLFDVATILAVQILLATQVRSQEGLDLSQISQCTLSCLLPNFQAVNCSLLDIDCQCNNDPLVETVSRCMMQECPLEDSLALGRTRDSLCGYEQETRQDTLLASSISCLVITTIIFALRLICRCFITKHMWADDWIMLAAMIFHIPFSGIALWMIVHGLGRHTWDVSLEMNTRIFQMYWVDEQFYIVILALTKVGLLVLYLRVFVGSWFQWAAKATLGFVILSAITFQLAALLQCLPVSLNWDRTVQGKCVNVNALTYAHAGVTILQDFMILGLPIPEILRLNLNRTKKFGVLLMFQVGVFACVTSIVRLRYLTEFGGTQSTDPLWENVDATLWTGLEVSVGIICSSMPAIRVLLTTLFPGFWEPIKRSMHGMQSLARGSKPKSTAYPDPVDSRASTAPVYTEDPAFWDQTQPKSSKFPLESTARGLSTVRETSEHRIPADNETVDKDLASGDSYRLPSFDLKKKENS